MRGFIVMILLCFSTAALAQTTVNPPPTVVPGTVSSNNLAAAVNVNQVAALATQAATAAPTAKVITIMVPTAGKLPGRVQVAPTDAEWATIVSEIQSIAARRAAAAQTTLGTIGLTVTP